MKFFVAGNGEIIEINGADHVAYAKRVLKSTLKSVLKKYVRVQIFNKFFSFETTQVRLSDSQRISLRRLYKNYGCVGYTGRVRSLGYTSPDNECVKTMNLKRFGV